MLAVASDAGGSATVVAARRGARAASPRALFFGGGAGGGSLPWLGGAAIVARARARGDARGARRLRRVRAARGARRLVGGLGRVVDRARPELGVREPRRSSTSPSRSSARSSADRMRRAVLGLAALLGAVCVWSLAGKVLPWLYEDYGRIARLRAPVGYWNALALLGAIALPIGLWLARAAARAGTLLVYGWIVAIALTYSRGGVVVAVLVVVAWIVLSRRLGRGARDARRRRACRRRS